MENIRYGRPNATDQEVAILFLALNKQSYENFNI